MLPFAVTNGPKTIWEFVLCERKYLPLVSAKCRQKKICVRAQIVVRSPALDTQKGMKFKTELQRVRRKFREGRLLAKESKISVGSISRMLNGKGRPSLTMLYKLVAVVDEETGARLLVAYLNDQIKPPLRDNVCVCVREKEGSPATCQCRDPLVQMVLAVRPEVRPHLEFIVRELLHPGSDHSPIFQMSRKSRKK